MTKPPANKALGDAVYRALHRAHAAYIDGDSEPYNDLFDDMLASCAMVLAAFAGPGKRKQRAALKVFKHRLDIATDAAMKEMAEIEKEGGNG